MSVLSDLFADIAGAIRSKTGDNATMKPTEFPDKIASLVIAPSTGIELKIASGEFKPSGSKITDLINHDMGVVPDVAFVFAKEILPEGGTFDGGIVASISYSRAAIASSGAKTTTFVTVGSGISTDGIYITDNIAQAQQMGIPHNANTKTFSIGGGTNFYLNPNTSYYWVAIGNIFTAGLG